MRLSSEKVLVATTLMIGAAQAQVSTNVNTQQTAPGSVAAITRQSSPTAGGYVVVPTSSVPNPGDRGKIAHTNYRFFVPYQETQAQSQTQAATPKLGPPLAGFFFNTPASLACIYSVVSASSGCDPNIVTKVSTYGSKVIAIVDAYHNSSALADLQTYSTQFGLPAPNLQIVYATGVQPPVDFNWAGEEALDLDMAHALAPNAKIILVEAASNSNADLLLAEDVASGLVAAAGGGQVSNSWGQGEFVGETTLDSHFTTPKVVYFASTGDDPGTQWPSVSANIVAVGGTTVVRSASGAFLGETTWASGGGGPSTYVARPTYQNGIAGVVGTARGVPDVSAVANPSTGVWVYCSTGCGNAPINSWFGIGGTSVSSPLVAALTNAAGHFGVSTFAELKSLYALLGSNRFNDITLGLCGIGSAYSAVAGWDFCTGVGTPHTPMGL
ncbi:S53 family peptidase [Methylocapsa acidiphila]|nr:S53 family peptidase [Methylocapsa acidiphila]